MVAQPECGKPVFAKGVIVDGAGKPVPGATVAAISKGSNIASQIARSSSEGDFALCLEAGEHAITVTHPEHGSIYAEPRNLQAAASEQLTIALPADGVRLHGRLTSALGDGYVRATRVGSFYGDIFYAPAAADGSYNILLPGGYRYVLDVQSDTSAAVPQHLRLDGELQRDIEVFDSSVVRAQLPPEGVRWIAENAAPLTAESASKDWASLSSLFSNARVIAAGENSHGAREFLVYRAALLKYLVAEHGARVLVLEAGFGETLALNEYVMGGSGNPQELLDSLGYWMWRTNEMVEVVEWLRAHNKSAPKGQRVQVFGMDVQYSHGAFSAVSDYLKAVDPALGKRFTAEAAPLGIEGDQSYSALAADDPKRQQTRDVLAAVISALDSNQKGFAAKTGAWRYKVARNSAASLLAFVKMRDDRSESYGIRDAAMAANVMWIVENAGGKAVLWAHNTHIARLSRGWYEPLGRHLSLALNEQYVAIGSFFYEGTPRAKWRPHGPGTRLELSEVPVGPAAPEFLESSLAATGVSAFALDLRRAMDGSPIKAWLAVPRMIRAISATYVDDASTWTLLPIPEHFDAILFVKTVSGTTPN